MKKSDSFTCPNKEKLIRISGDDAKTTVYANKSACRKCPNKSKCFKQGGKHNYRTINKNEYFKDMLKADKLFEENIELYHRRQEMSEHVFGSIKR